MWTFWMDEVGGGPAFKLNHVGEQERTAPPAGRVCVRGGNLIGEQEDKI